MCASLLHQVPASSNLEVIMQIIRYNSVSTLVMTASMQTSFILQIAMSVKTC